MRLPDRSTPIRLLSAIAAVWVLTVPTVNAQQMPSPGFKSVGRGAPLVADLRKYEIVGPATGVPFGTQPKPGTPKDTVYYAARDGAAPPGVTPLPIAQALQPGTDPPDIGRRDVVDVRHQVRGSRHRAAAGGQRQVGEDQVAQAFGRHRVRVDAFVAAVHRGGKHTAKEEALLWQVQLAVGGGLEVEIAQGPSKLVAMPEEDLVHGHHRLSGQEAPGARVFVAIGQ
jgi:hypothetical protein